MITLGLVEVSKAITPRAIEDKGMVKGLRQGPF
jgi:hypothetical protein